MIGRAAQTTMISTEKKAQQRRLAALMIDYKTISSLLQDEHKPKDMPSPMITKLKTYAQPPTKKPARNKVWQQTFPNVWLAKWLFSCRALYISLIYKGHSPLYLAVFDANKQWRWQLIMIGKCNISLIFSSVCIIRWKKHAQTKSFCVAKWLQTWSFPYHFIGGHAWFD